VQAHEACVRYGITSIDGGNDDCLLDRAIVASQAQVTVQKPTQLKGESPSTAPARAGLVFIVPLLSTGLLVVRGVA